MVGVNKQTLLYYDKIHLFSPEYVDDMGYRYYTFTQLDCFYAIITLKTIGMSLEEIKNTLIQGTPKEQQSFCKKAFWKQRRKLRSLLRCPEK